MDGRTDGSMDAQPHIFVSYRRTDGAAVRPVIAELERQGYRVWYDVDGIGPGGRIASEIQRNIENCAVFLAFLSKSYGDSRWCMDEISLARKYGKWVLPVKLDEARLENGLDLLLAQYNIVSWQDTETLIRQMRRIPDCEKCRTVPTVKAEAPPSPPPDPEPTSETRKKKHKRTTRRFYPVSKIIGVMLAFMVVITAIVILQGRIGRGWTLKDGVLTISKSILDDNGRMPDYSLDSPAPWTKRREEITKAVIETGIPNIGAYSFMNCQELETVSIPDSVTEIGWGAFAYCTSLTSVTIPDSVTEIGSRAFSGCTGLTSITIPDSVTEIGNRAFSGCTGLTSVTIPDSVTAIGVYAFSGCTGLTSVTIPDSVTYIGNGVFYGCDNLSTVYILGSRDFVQIGYEAFSEKHTTVIYGPPPEDAAA